jgi:hypothetical protein
MSLFLQDREAAASSRRPRLVSATIDIAKMWVLALALASQTALSGGTHPDPPPEEYELKAAFVLNFIRLVNWEDVPGEKDSSDLPVCALANSDFANAVRQAVAGKMAGKRSISFKLTRSPDPLRCRTLIVDSTEYPVARPALNAVGNAQVLTIGNGPGFLPIGGMFELVVQERKVQFNASLDAVRGANLDVSARLLQLSRNLRRGANSGF